MEWVYGADLRLMGERDYAAQLIQHLSGQIRANPEDRRSYFLRGNAYLDQGAFSLAIEDFTRAIELDPQDPVAYNNRGIAHRSLEQTEQAIEDYRQALVLDEGNATARGLVARLP